mmetsp:Transcript_7681/g.28804  ORF Transcript_7681/g.28804 Transcript_7681/m.28804 type:complete len:238 (-) Transcript_7681:848-1561(-)
MQSILDVHHERHEKQFVWHLELVLVANDPIVELIRIPVQLLHTCENALIMLPQTLQLVLYTLHIVFNGALLVLNCTSLLIILPSLCLESIALFLDGFFLLLFVGKIGRFLQFLMIIFDGALIMLPLFFAITLTIVDLFQFTLFLVVSIGGFLETAGELINFGLDSLHLRIFFILLAIELLLLLLKFLQLFHCGSHQRGNLLEFLFCLLFVLKKLFALNLHRGEFHEYFADTKLLSLL